VTLSALGSSPTVAAECTSATLNKNCVIAIDREAPVSPLPVRITPESKVTLQVTKRPLEQIVFDVTLADTLAPDPLSAIFAAFLKPITAFVTTQKLRLLLSVPRDPQADDFIKNKLEPIARAQELVQRQLATFDEKLTTLASQLKTFQRTRAGFWTIESFKTFQREFVCKVLGSGIQNDKEETGQSAVCPAGEGISGAALPLGEVAALHELITAVLKEFAALPPDVRKEVSAAMNAIVSDQSQIRVNVKTLQAKQTALFDAASFVRSIDASKMTLRDERVIGGFPQNTTRTATVKITAQDLVSKTTTTLGTVVIVWGGTRWEVSGGALFSALHNRTFQNSPIIENGIPKVDSSGKTTTRITETQTRPTVVPVAVMHYRFGETVLPGQSQRIALLWALGIGINPNSGSADFATGPTFSYRGLMISPVLHYVRDLRLTNGLYSGLELGSAPPPLGTERHWVGKFALAVSYRVPIS
jgi:hypothetical protein